MQVILIGLVMSRYNPIPYIKSRKCLKLSCDSCCNKSIFKSRQTNSVLLLRSLFTIGPILSPNTVDNLCPGALYAQLIKLLLCFKVNFYRYILRSIIKYNRFIGDLRVINFKCVLCMTEAETEVFRSEFNVTQLHSAYWKDTLCQIFIFNYVLPFQKS